MRLITRTWVLCLAVALSGLRLEGSVVTTLDGREYDGEASLEPGNMVSVVLPDSSRQSIPLDEIKTAKFASRLVDMANFGPIAAGWTNRDVGDVTISGAAAQSNSLFVVQVGSAEMGGRADSFHYVHVPASGDVEIVARVVSISGDDGLARAGLMFRDSLAPDAKFALASISANGQASFQHRAVVGQAAAAGGSVPASLPSWLKLSRRGTNFTAAHSIDGRAWQQLGLASMNMNNNCHVGLAVAGRSGVSFCSALIGNVSRTVPGVRSEYFADMDFGRLFTNRVDPSISFFWDGTPPVEGAPANNYSVRWTGEFEPKFSEDYLFHADSGDARLWINGKEFNLALFRPNMPAGRATNAANATLLALKAGNRYPFRFEYRHTSGRALVRFGWSSASQAQEPLQPRHLFCVLEARAQPGGPRSVTNALAMGRGVLLRDGTFLSGVIRSFSGDSLKFTHRGEKDYTVRLRHVARAVLNMSPRNALLGNANLAEGALLSSGNFIEGRLQCGPGRDVKVSSVPFGLKTYSLDAGDLAALVFGSASPGGARYALRMADNSIVMAKTVSVAQGQVDIVEPLLGALQVPRDAVTEIRGIQPEPKQ